MICLFSSSLTNIATEVTYMIIKIPCEVTPFIIHFQNKFEEFKLLDYIIIGNSFFIACIAGLFTYGIIIAAFNSK